MDFSRDAFRDPLRRGIATIVDIPLDTSEAETADLQKLLARDELARADRFVLPDIRRRFIACRGRTRQLLGMLSNTPPSAVQFNYSQWGKPSLSTTEDPKPFFNVSHSADQALLAISCFPIGVDLEIPRSNFRYRSIASQVICPQEQADWDVLPERNRNTDMLKLWVCKEALLKAMGLGIAEGLQQVSFPLPIPDHGPFAPLRIDPAMQLHLDDDGTCSMNHWIDPSSWRMQLLSVGETGNAAVAVSRSVTTIQQIDFASTCVV